MRGLRELEVLTVSGVIDGMDNETVLRLSQVKVVERPEQEEQQPGRASRGYFQAEFLVGTLEKAAGRVQRDFSVKDMLSMPYKVNNKFVVDFWPPSFPKGMSFSLDNILPDNSNNTLTFNIAMPQDGPQPNPHLVMACMSMIMYASQPGVYMDEYFDKINRALKDEKPITINGWTYSGHADKIAFTFSATAPGQ